MKTTRTIRLAVMLVGVCLLLGFTASCGHRYHSRNGLQYYWAGYNDAYDAGYDGFRKDPKVLDDFYGPDYTEGYHDGYASGKDLLTEEQIGAARIDGMDLGAKDAKNHFEYDPEVCFDHKRPTTCRQGYHDGYYEARRTLRDSQVITRHQPTANAPLYSPLSSTTTTTIVSPPTTVSPSVFLPPTTSVGMEPTG